MFMTYLLIQNLRLLESVSSILDYLMVYKCPAMGRRIEEKYMFSVLTIFYETKVQNII